MIVPGAIAIMGVESAKMAAALVALEPDGPTHAMMGILEASIDFTMAFVEVREPPGQSILSRIPLKPSEYARSIALLRMSSDATPTDSNSTSSHLVCCAHAEDASPRKNQIHVTNFKCDANVHFS